MKAIFYQVVAITLALTYHTAPAGEEKAPAAKVPKAVELILKQTNAERAKEMLPALKLDPKLLEAAQKHTDDMARQKMMSHTLDGKGPADRLRKIGYEFASMGENVAMGMKAKDAVDAWMKSKGHRANILNKDYTEIGIGVAKDEDGTPYYTQVFGKPLGADEE